MEVIDPHTDCPIGRDVLCDDGLVIGTELDISGTNTIVDTRNVPYEGTTGVIKVSPDDEVFPDDEVPTLESQPY